MDAVSIEQMNKVRVSLGMAPLPVPGAGPQHKKAESSDDSGSESEEASTVETRQAAAGSNWQKLEAEKKDKVERQKRKDAAKKSRDAAARFSKLEGKGLGDADGEEGEMDTRSWLLQQKKRQKKIEKARKMEEELASREQQAEYTSRDLAGVKVGHGAGEFEDTAGEQVLTLKDAEIGEESDEDELENAELKAKESLEQRLDSKKKRPDYDPTEQSEAKNVLSKYDEEIHGKKKTNFTIDASGSTVPAKKALDGDGEVKSRGVKINLDMLNDDAPVSDYVDPSTIKMKKPKKKKEKKSRQKVADEDDIVPPTDPKPAGKDTEAMEVDAGQEAVVSSNKKRTFDFDDDDDLQTKLAEQRRQALKKRKKTDAAELARQMREEMPIDEENAEEGGLTIDETTEFVTNLKKPEAPETKSIHNQTPQPASAASPEPEEDEDGDTAMANQSYAEVDEGPSSERPRAASHTAPGVTATGLEDEQSMSGEGLGASLAMLRKRGLVSNPDEKLSERERQRNQFLADKQHLIDDFDRNAKQQREEERRKGTWDRMSHRDREEYARRQNESRERYLNQLLDDSYKKNYKPNVELRYTDEFGRDMNQKEAFKHMSHMFHGKGSGKGKTEKRLKKIEGEEKERKKGVLSLEGEGGMREVQGREGKRMKMAGVRLQ